MGQKSNTTYDVDSVIYEWVRDQLKNGEDPEIIKESLVILNQDPSIVDKVLKELEKSKPKQAQKKKEKTIEEKVEKLKEEITQEVLKKEKEKKVEQEVSKEIPPIEQKAVRVNIPKEDLPPNESLKELEKKKPLSRLKLYEMVVTYKLKDTLPWVLIILGLSLILIAVYIYFYF